MSLGTATTDHLDRHVVRHTADADPIARLAATVMAEHNLLHEKAARWCNESCRLASEIVTSDIDR